jgi:hypothetical protein
MEKDTMPAFVEENISAASVRRARKKAHAGGPTLSAIDAAAALNMSRQWILELARRDPATTDNFLPGYVKNPAGTGWIRKTGPSKERRDVMFYEDDVLLYKEKHPEPQDTDVSGIEVDETTRKLIIEIATPELEEKGFVTRRRVRDEMIARYSYTDRVYEQIMRVASDCAWPLPRRQPKNTAKKRRKTA